MRRVGGLVAVVSCAFLSACAATTLPVSGLTASSATLNAAGRTDSTAAHYYFQFATAVSALGTGFGLQTPTVGPIPAGRSGPGGGLLPFSESVTGLKAATTYFYRVCGGDGQTRQDVCAQTVSFMTPAGVAYSTPGIYAWTVPAGVTHAQFDVTGAQGGPSSAGGLGAHMEAVLQVNAGATLTIVVGQAGGLPGGGAGGGGTGGSGAPIGGGDGGGGGGESDVRAGAPGVAGSSTRLLVAGGGGGSGGAAGGLGGAGGLTGSAGQPGPVDNAGGYWNFTPAPGGGGGSATSGGSPGDSTDGGTAGGLVAGGMGGSNTTYQIPNPPGSGGYAGVGGGAAAACTAAAAAARAWWRRSPRAIRVPAAVVVGRA